VNLGVGVAVRHGQLRFQLRSCDSLLTNRLFVNILFASPRIHKRKTPDHGHLPPWISTKMKTSAGQGLSADEGALAIPTA
jgi:hypothetical protein